MITGTLGTLLEWSACLHISTMMTVVNFALVALFIFILPLTNYWFIPLLYLPWYLYDINTPYKGGRQSRFLRSWRIWKYMARYFPIKLHKTVDLDPSKNYIFGFHPHGFLVYGGFCNFCTNGTGFDELFPGLTVHMLVLNGQFKFPLYREYLLSAGFGSANKDSIDYKLTKLGPGHSVWLAIGGAAEVFYFEHRFYKLKILSRKGFIRRALFTGANVVPVFSFGEHRLYKATLPEKGSCYWYIQKLVRFVSNLDLPVDVRGRSNCWYFVPRRIPINTVVGEPIDFCQLKSHCEGTEPPNAMVDECHELYLQALRKLYDDHKAQFGDESTPLIFN